MICAHCKEADAQATWTVGLVKYIIRFAVCDTCKDVLTRELEDLIAERQVSVKKICF
jgi:hypothetical protein